MGNRANCASTAHPQRTHKAHTAVQSPTERLRNVARIVGIHTVNCVLMCLRNELRIYAKNKAGAANEDTDVRPAVRRVGQCDSVPSVSSQSHLRALAVRHPTLHLYILGLLDFTTPPHLLGRTAAASEDDSQVLLYTRHAGHRATSLASWVPRDCQRGRRSPLPAACIYRCRPPPHSLWGARHASRHRVVRPPPFFFWRRGGARGRGRVALVPAARRFARRRASRSAGGALVLLAAASGALVAPGRAGVAEAATPPRPADAR